MGPQRPKFLLAAWVFKRAWLWVLTWALVIFVLCATPGEYIPSNNWLDLLSVDKLVHAGIFFVLNALCFTAIVKGDGTRSKLIIATVCCMAYGASLELMQATLFRNRTADWMDMIANGSGCLFAFFALKKIRRDYEIQLQ